MTHSMHFCTGFFRRYPIATFTRILPGLFIGAGKSQLTVKRHCRFQRNKWLLRSNPVCKRFIEAVRLFFASASENLDARRAEALKAATGIDGIRIIHCRDHALHPRSDDCFRAWASAPSVIARFERDVERRAAGLIACRL